MVNGKLTVLFENPYLIGIFEREEDGKYEILKVTFGSEPKDYQVYEYILKSYHNIKFSKPVNDDKKKSCKKMNPKRMQREISKSLKNQSIGTKAQKAIKLEQEQCKLERKKSSRQRKIENKEEQFALKQKKRKEKHRGH